MLLLTRTRTARPERVLEAMALAIESTALVAELTGQEWSCHTALQGAPLGTLSWSGWIPSLEQLATHYDTLLGDERYRDVVVRAGQLFEDGHDSLVEVVHSAGGASNTHADWATITTHVPANGRLADAMAMGVQMTDFVSGVTGHPCGFFNHTAGRLPRVTWVFPSESAAGIDDARAKLAAEPRYVEMIDDAGDLWVAGQMQRTLVRRIA